MSAARDLRPLSERLRPSSLREVLGNARAVSELDRWAKSWEESRSPPARRAALLEGPPGVGKTTAALAVAADHGWTVVEMNASDARNQSAIEEVAGRASLTHTLGSTGEYRAPQQGGRTLILLDEADCLTGRAVEETPHPRSNESFRDFLRSRYGTVGALASAWGLGTPGAPRAWTEWSDVPATAGRGGWTRLAAAQRDAADWRGSQRRVDNSDRGGLGAIARLVRETRQPVVLTVNDSTTLTRYSPVFRSAVARIRFGAVGPTEMRSLLRRVVAAEGLTVPGPALSRILERSEGDVRAALNDLEAIAPLPRGADFAPILGGRDRVDEIRGFVTDILGDPRVYRSVEIRNRLDVPPDELFPWVEEMVAQVRGDDRARNDAFDHVVVADRFLNWARRQRVWSLWSFAGEVMTGGVALALATEGGPDIGPVAFPQYLGAMGRTRAMRALRQRLLDKIGERFHVSRRKGIDGYFPIVEALLSTGDVPGSTSRRHAPPPISVELGLTAEEIGLLVGRDPADRRVQELAAPPPDRTEDEAVGVGEAPAPPPLPTKSSSPVERPAAKRAESRKRVQKQLAEF